jgi:ATP-dependent Clp protease ATP-binding subunit ClpC
MLSDRECRAFQVLKAAGASERALFETVHSLIDPDRSKGRFTDGLTFRARLVVDLAVEEALRADSPIGSEFFLMGILREGDGIAARALVRHGVGLDRVRVHTELLGILEAYPRRVAA